MTECPDCKHPIANHGDEGCITFVDARNLCECPRSWDELRAHGMDAFKVKRPTSKET